MKIRIVASILGLVSGLVSSQGQGFVNFANYASTVNAPVTYAALNVPAGKAGLTVGQGFTAELLWGIGDLTGNLGSLTAVATTAFPSVADGNTGSGAGYFLGGAVTLPGVTSANSGSITFLVRAFNGASWTATQSSPAGIAGQSLAWVQAVATGTSPVPDFTGFQSFTVQNVPEPATFVLGGLGAAALLLFRRRRS